MPTNTAKARKRLLADQAKVKWRKTFTIKPTRPTGDAQQEIILSVNAGYKHISLSASTHKRELFASKAKLCTDISKLRSFLIEVRTRFFLEKTAD